MAQCNFRPESDDFSNRRQPQFRVSNNKLSGQKNISFPKGVACYHGARFHHQKTKKVENLRNFFNELYTNFNERKIEQVIVAMTDDVQWANGMDGGYVHGHDGVREYWTRQFTMISSNVTPIQIDADNSVVKIKVHQVVYDVAGKLIADEIVSHFFHLRGDRIARFDIGEKTRDN